MNSRERMLAVLNHETPDRVPTDIWAVPEVRASLRAHFQADDEGVGEALHIDGIAGVGAKYVGPPLPETPEGEKIDLWGVRRKRVVYDTGEYYEMSQNPLGAAETLDDLEAYPWPEPDWFDTAEMPATATEGRKRQVVSCGYMAPFTYHIYLRGLENALMDPLIRPEFTHHLLGRLGEFFHEHHRRMFAACDGLIDLAQVTDDYGMQTGPIMSMPTFRTFYRPHLKRFIDLTHEFGIRVFHHDDGAIRDFIPDLTAMGIDLLNPIQWRCDGMDRAELKRTFGDRLVFHGGVDNQQTLPFASADDVRAEVRENIDILASDRTGYVLAPCHNIQANTPVENIVAMYDEAHHYGRF